MIKECIVFNKLFALYNIKKFEDNVNMRDFNDQFTKKTTDQSFDEGLEFTQDQSLKNSNKYENDMVVRKMTVLNYNHCNAVFRSV